MTPNWWLVAVAFLLGVVLTLAYTVRRVRPQSSAPAGSAAPAVAADPAVPTVEGAAPDPDAPPGTPTPAD